MLQNIFVGVMCVIVGAVAVWGWWMENGPDRSGSGSKKKQSEEKDEQEGA